jgi:hypothetical protein
MVRSPRATLNSVVISPRSIDLAILIVFIAAVCSVGFLMTRVGQLAALDQQVRQLESFGAVINDDTYAELRRWVPYRPAISAALIVIGWPLWWVSLTAILKAIGDRTSSKQPTFAQVLAVVVHASSVLALRSMIAAPVNYARESIGGATSLSVLLPAFGESTFPARLLGAVDVFVLWWVVLVAMGFGILYETRTVSVARWLLCAYTAGAVVLAITQALRGGV